MDYEQIFNELLISAQQLRFQDDVERKRIIEEIELYGERLFASDKYTSKAKDIMFHVCVSPCSQEYKREIWESGRQELCILIQTMIKDCHLSDCKPTKSVARSKSKVFIVHGHNEALKYEMSDWLRSVGIEPVILHLQPNGGLSSILAKIESNADVDAAVILFTADDVGRAKSEKNLHDRARQNVVFEAGYFAGRLSCSHVVVLHEQSVELPSDLSGIVFISTAGQWKEDLRREFSNMGLKYNPI